MTPFWSLFIVGFTLANIAFALIVLYLTARKRAKAAPEAETTGHVWDGDLRELNKPLPRWWLYAFYLSVLFGVVYLVLYPGLGAYEGTFGWTQVGQYREQVRSAEAKSAPVYARFSGKDIGDLETDPAALRIAQNLFAANCSMCHGSDARGAPGFPDLTAANWQWGRDPAAVEATIGGGRAGVMPAWGVVVGERGVEELANYVVSLSGLPPHPELVAAGKERFEQLCTACHGPDAHGNPLLGAPNLADDNWLYGGSIDVVRKTIAEGRENHMPAHLGRLGPVRVKLLASYVLHLGARERAVPEAPHVASP